MDLARAADHLVLLSEAKRFAIIHQLAEAGGEWLSIRELATKTDLTTGSVRNQIRHLVKAGLAQTKKRGRKLICSAHIQELNDFIDSLSAALRPNVSELPVEVNTVSATAPEPAPKKAEIAVVETVREPAKPAVTSPQQPVSAALIDIGVDDDAEENEGVRPSSKRKPGYRSLKDRLNEVDVSAGFT